MSVQAKAVPHFSGKKQLSLQDLDSLADAVQAHGMTTEYVPAGMPRGRRQYTGANYNLAQFVDECNGETATPDKPGIISSVQYLAAAAPYIDSGNIVLPLAHDYDPADDSSIPTEQATGGVAAIRVGEGLKRSLIDRGTVLLAEAHSSWGDAEGAMSTPGVVHSVDWSACVGSCCIEHGEILLPLADSGELNCEGSTVGLISGVVTDVNTEEPYISHGVIHLPPGGGGSGGSLSGMVNTSGENVPWSQMEDEPVRVAVMFLDGYRLYITAQIKNGFLCLDTEAI